MKLRKMLALFAAMLLLASLMLAGCGASSSEETAKEGTTEKAAEAATGLSAEEGKNAGVVTGNTDYSFTLEGKTYTLPVDFSQFEADGWKADIDTDQELGGMTYSWLDMQKDGKEDGIEFYVFNGSGNTKKVKDCKIAGIKVLKRDIDEIGYSFALSNGLKPGDDKDTVLGVMGQTENVSDNDTSYSLQYGESRQEGEINFVWFKDEDSQAQGQDYIEVEFFQQEQTASSNEVPDYLSEYKAPASLGADFDSATFTLDQVVYQLPCPVSEFVNNGWTLTKTEEVMSDRTGLCTLEKGGAKVECTVINFAEYQTDASNCAVKEISISSYSDEDPVPDLLLPKNVKPNMTIDELKAALAGSGVKFEENDSDNYVTYSYYDYDLGVKAYFYCDKEKARLTNLDIGGEKWPGKD